MIFRLPIKYIEFISLFTLFGVWIYTLLSYPSLPDNIAIHFDVNGHVKNHGSKSTVFGLPLLASLFYLVVIYLKVFIKKEYHKNKTSPKFTFKKYKSIIKIIDVSKLSFILLFALSTIKQIQTANSKSFGSWYSFIIIVLILIPLLYSVIRSLRM